MNQFLNILKTPVNQMSIEPHIEGVNVILCPQIIRYLYKVFCEPPTSNPEG